MSRSTSLTLWFLGSLVLSVAGQARACQICLPMPTESLADRILESEHLILARENPDKPFSLRAITWLKQGSAEAPPLDLFLDSTSRRRLAANGDLTILCGWTPGAPDWRRLALYDETLAPIVESILRNRERWQETPAERTRFFADFLGHEATVVSDLAHIEVAGSPYSLLKQFADRLPRETLLEKLENARRMKWHALYILFLAQSDDPRDHDRIREEIAGAAGYGLVIRTAAWATAFLELDGAKAVDRLGDWYGEGQSRRPEERSAILAALTVHGNEGDSTLRDPIVGLLGEFLESQPDLAPSIAALLMKWDRDDLADPIAALLRESPEQFDTTATLTLRRYLRQSRPPASEPKEDETPGNLVPVLLLLSLVGLAFLLGLRGRLVRRPTVPSSPVPDNSASPPAPRNAAP